MLHVILSLLGIFCGIAALILVCLWAQDATTSDPQYLGTPEWENDKYPSYHPVLMVGGFFFAQVLGISMWSLIPDHTLAKTLHALFMLAAIGTMVAGLHAVIDYEKYSNIPQLTSMHSWLGVMTVIIFGMQVVGGFTMGIMTMAAPANDLVKSIAVMHRGMGMAAFIVSTMTILAGIQNQLIGPRAINGAGFRGSCGYSQGEHPEQYYLSMPEACRIAYGCGVCVVLAALFTCMSVYARSYAVVSEIQAQQQQHQYQQANNNHNGGVPMTSNSTALVKSDGLAVVPHQGAASNGEVITA